MTNYNQGRRFGSEDLRDNKSQSVASVNLRRAALVLGVVGVLSTTFVLGAPYWRSTMNWGRAAIVTNLWEFEGLFLTCVNNGGQSYSQCVQLYAVMGNTGGVQSGYDPLIYPYLNAFRALMIIAFITSLAGVVCSALGMRCATVVDEESRTKRWILIIGGICHIATGVLTGVCVSWYAAEVVREYYDPLFQAQKLRYTLGACLYVGWVSMLFSLIAGILMSCCTCFNKSADSRYYAYQPTAIQEKSSYPMPAADTYTAKPIYKEDNYSRKPEYRSSRHFRRSHHSSHHSTPRHHSRDTFSSHSSNSGHSGRHHSPKTSHHDSDILRASGFV